MNVKEQLLLVSSLTFILCCISCESSKKKNTDSKIANTDGKNSNEVNNTPQSESAQDLAVSHLLKAWSNMKILNNMTDKGINGYIPGDSKESTTRNNLISDTITNINAAIVVIEARNSILNSNKNEFEKLPKGANPMNMDHVKGDSLLAEEAKEIRDCPSTMKIFAANFQNVVRYMNTPSGSGSHDPVVGEILIATLRNQISYYQSVQRSLKHSEGLH